MNPNKISYGSDKILSKLILFYAVPFSIFIFIGFYFLWKNEINFAQKLNIIQDNLLLTILVFFFSVIVHELLHALAYLMLEKGSYKSLNFGFSSKLFNPYCHYSKRVKVWKYRFVLALPGFILGLLPIIYALVFGNFYSLIYGIVFTIGAIGDFYILWKLRNIKSSKYVRDSPNKMGCIID